MAPASEALMIAEAFWGVVDWDRQEMAVTARTTGRTRKERRRSMSSYRTSRACDAATKMIEGVAYLACLCSLPWSLSAQTILTKGEL
jgi:hypothetical protein